MEWRSNPKKKSKVSPSRRQFLVGAGIGGALILGYELWPRRYLSNLVPLAGETIFNGYLKIGSDGHVTVIVPQIELGQASTTLIPQIIADELGADWRTVGVEAAPLNPLYGNMQFEDVAGWRWRFAMTASLPLQVTEENLTLKAYAEPVRALAAMARTLLCMAAAKHWDVESSACETAGGFVLHGKRRLRFGALAELASRVTPPDVASLRQGASNRLIGSSLPRLDAPAKIDGSANYAADIRLPGMVFATIRQGPLGESVVTQYDEAAARKTLGAVDIYKLPNGLVAIASTSWAAAKMLDAAAPSFSTSGKLAESAQIIPKLESALKAAASRELTIGDSENALASGHTVSATYHIGLLPHLALEPLAVTARYEKGLLEVWTSAQLPNAARMAAASVTGLAENKIVIHSVMGGGSFGRRFELECVRQAAKLALMIKRPVQFFWSRGEDMMHDRFGGACAATLTAQVLPNGGVNAWQSALAAPATMAELKSRTLGGQTSDAAMRANAGGSAPDLLATAQPLYTIPNVALDFHAADIGIPTGPMRGGAGIATCFFNESFINELSSKSGVEPLSFRMALLGNNQRLAQCLAKVTALAGWSGGGQGTNQGIASYTTDDACIAVVAEAKFTENGRLRVSKLTAVADVGQLVNPDIARQQIEGGLLFGISIAVSAPVVIKNGIPGPIKLGDLHLPRMSEMPEINIELILNNAPSADIWDLAVPPVAPAIAGALFAGSGKRYRTLPFTVAQSE